MKNRPKTAAQKKPAPKKPTRTWRCYLCHKRVDIHNLCPDIINPKTGRAVNLCGDCLCEDS